VTAVCSESVDAAIQQSFYGRVLTLITEELLELDGLNEASE